MLTKSTRIYVNNALTSWLFTIVIIICIWLLLTQNINTSTYFPSLYEFRFVLVEDYSVLLIHFVVTFLSALSGFVIGLLVAIILTLISIIFRSMRDAIALISIILYSIPLIAAAPITALIFGSQYSGAVLGAIGAFLPIYLSGIRASDSASNAFAEMALAHGGSEWDINKTIRAPLVLRGWFVGAESGWLWAVLGALLGDFTGGRWGLGTFIIGTLARGNPARVWVIVILCLSLSFIGLIVIKVLSKMLIGQGYQETLENLLPENDNGGLKSRKHLFQKRLLQVVILLILWQVVSSISNIGGGVISGPIDIASLGINIISGLSEISFGDLLLKFSATFSLAFIGIILSLLVAFIVASLQYLSPIISRPIVLMILITQVTPIVAFVPLIAFFIGRDNSAVIIIVIFSTIYPSYTIFLKSLKSTPDLAIEVVRSFGGNKLAELIIVRIPNAAWMSIVAFRLAVGRAFLGAMTAEYLLTGNGLGGILGETRSLLDFRFVWLICSLIGLVTFILDYSISFLEKKIRPLYRKELN